MTASRIDDNLFEVMMQILMIHLITMVSRASTEGREIGEGAVVREPQDTQNVRESMIEDTQNVGESMIQDTQNVGESIIEDTQNV